MPLSFVVVRKRVLREPFWQLFHMHYHPQQNAYTVTTPEEPHQLFQVNEDGPLEVDHLHVLYIRIALPGEQVRKIAFWKVPVLLRNSTGSLIPVFDFPFKAWLPRPTHRIPITRTPPVLTLLHRLEERWSYLTARTPSLKAYEIDVDSQSERMGILYAAFSPTDILYPRVSSSSSDDETLSVHTVSPPSSPSSSNSVMRPIPIPDLVGSLLIQNARSSDDACPITALPYRESDQLSVTSCFHVFETGAIQRWLQESSSCPVCRHSVTNVVTQ